MTPSPRSSARSRVTEPLIAFAVWLGVALGVGAARGPELAIVAGATFLPVLVISVTEPDGMRGFAHEHPLIDALAGLPLGFFTVAVLDRDASMWDCLAVGLLTGIVLLGLRLWRLRRARPVAPRPASP